MPTRERRLAAEAAKAQAKATAPLAPYQSEDMPPAPTPEQPTQAEFTSRMSVNGFELRDLPLVYAPGEALGDSQGAFKHYDISQAPADYDAALAAYEAKQAELAQANAALAAISQPAQFQPKPGENSIFDGIQSQLQSAQDERQYQQIRTVARSRIADAQKAQANASERLVVVAYLADLHDLRVRVAPAVESYRQAIAAAQRAHDAAYLKIQEAIKLQGGVSPDDKGLTARHAYLPVALELSRISLGAALPVPPPSVLGDEGEIDLFPQNPLQKDFVPYVAPYIAPAIIANAPSGARRVVSM